MIKKQGRDEGGKENGGSWENFCGQKFSQTLSKNFNLEFFPVPDLAVRNDIQSFLTSE